MIKSCISLKIIYWNWAKVNYQWMPVWSMQRRGGQHCSSHTYTRLFQTAVSTLFHSCLNTRSQFFKWMLAPHSLLNIWTKPQQKRPQNKLIESWAEPEQCLVWCLLFQTHQTRWSKSLRFGHLYWRWQARLSLWARLTLTAYEDKAALYESNTPVALIPQRAWSQYTRSWLLEQIFLVSQSSWLQASWCCVFNRCMMEVMLM